MLRILVASLTIAGSGALDAAIAREYPFCIKGCDFGAVYHKSRSATKPHLAACQLQPKETLIAF